MESTDTARNDAYEQIYVLLAGFFIAALVACNLIFLKFFSIPIQMPWGELAFEQSVGLLAYPFTFLVTDILSEVYGRRRANRVVLAGFFASIFVVVLLLIATSVPAMEGSPVDSSTFEEVFGLSWAGMTASMAAYLCAQFLDIRFFHFWKKLTRGRHLWLRNNLSTIASQLVDTALVLSLLCTLGAISWSQFNLLFLNGIGFKWLVALIDTPLFYLAVILFRRWFPHQTAAVDREVHG